MQWYLISNCNNTISYKLKAKLLWMRKIAAMCVLPWQMGDTSLFNLWDPLSINCERLEIVRFLLDSFWTFPKRLLTRSRRSGSISCWILITELSWGCLVLQYNCGSRTNHNSTYFVNNGYPSSFNTIGQCSTTIEKVCSAIVSLKFISNIRRPAQMCVSWGWILMRWRSSSQTQRLTSAPQTGCQSFQTNNYPWVLCICCVTTMWSQAHCCQIIVLQSERASYR